MNIPPNILVSSNGDEDEEEADEGEEEGTDCEDAYDDNVDEEEGEIWDNGTEPFTLRDKLESISTLCASLSNSPSGKIPFSFNPSISSILYDINFFLSNFIFLKRILK